MSWCRGVVWVSGLAGAVLLGVGGGALLLSQARPDLLECWSGPTRQLQPVLQVESWHRHLQLVVLQLVHIGQKCGRSSVGLVGWGGSNCAADSFCATMRLRLSPRQLDAQLGMTPLVAKGHTA